MLKESYRILEISYKHKLSHIGSCLSALSLIDDCYKNMKENDIFVLGGGHCGLALYVILEKYFGFDAEKLFLKHGVHPKKDLGDKIFVSSGSLGLPETIACGFAISDRLRNVFLVSTDGGSTEGSFTEALLFKRDNYLNNLIWLISANKYSAYKNIPHRNLFYINHICNDVQILNTEIEDIPFLKDLSAHYYVMNENDWKWVEENR
jgi:transketolase N-terminal domain/subunit